MSRSDRNPHLPPWLQDVPLPPKPSEPGQDVSGAPLFSGLPEWLRDEDETDQSPTPSWLIPAPDTPESDVSAPAWAPDTSTTTFDVPAAAETSPPSWLQSLRESLVTPEAMGPEEKLAEPEPFTFASASDADAEISDAGFHSGSPADSSEAKGPSWLVDERFEQRAEETPALNASSALPAWPGIGPDESTEPVDLPAWLRELPVADDAEQKPSLASSSEIHSEDLPDWLRDLAAAPPKPPAAPPEPPSGRPAGSPHLPPASDLPDWLREIAAAPPEPPAAPPEPPSGRPGGASQPASDLPDWLRDLAAAPPEPPSGRPGGASQPASDLPDWLRDLAAAPPEPPSGRPAGSPHLPPASDLPDWLREIAAAPPEPPAAPPEPPSGQPAGSPRLSPASDLPDWLRDLAAAPPEPPAAPPEPPSGQPAGSPHLPPASDLPDWLRDLAAAPPEPPSGQPAGSPHLPPASDLPDWLRDLAAAPPEPPSGRPAGSPHLPPASDLPDWLREIAAALPEPPAAPSEPPPRRPSGAPQPVSDLSDQLQTTAPLSQETPPWLESEHKQLPAAAPGDALLPDWPRGADGVLSDTRDGRSQISQPAAPQISSDLLSGTDLPDWLRGEPESKPESVPFSPPNLDDWLVRLRSATDDEVGVGALVAAPKLAPPPAPKRSEEQLRALSLLRHLAAEPIPATTPLLAPAPESVLRRVGVERLLSITLLILAIIAVAFPGIAPFLETPPVMPAVSTAHEQIAALDANDVALIGYEWDARRVGELRPLEQAVIGQLIAQNVKLILVSTDPQGTLLQFDLLDALRDAGYRQQGEGYLLLGYKPGGEIALRTLGRDFQGMLRSDYRGDDATGSALIAGIDTGRPIASLNDLSLIIVLADDTSDVQGWMEQVYPQLQTGNRPVSLVFLLPEEAAPIVQPYMRQPGVVAIAGQRGALAYMALNQGGGASEVAKAAIQHRLTILLFVVVLLFGLAISGIDAVRRRRT